MGRGGKDRVGHPLGPGGGRSIAAAGDPRCVRVELLRRPIRRPLGRCTAEVGSTRSRHRGGRDRPACGGGTGRAACAAAAPGAGWAGSGAGGAGRGRVRAAAGRHIAGGARGRLPGAPRRAGGADQPVPVRRPGNLRRRHCPDAGRAPVHPRRRITTAGRLATRHQLAWHELDALRACAELDRAEGRNGGWAAKADALHKRLVPPGLDPDPLGTVERLVAEQKAAEEADDENEGVE
jgi:hypothetical protein